MATATISKKVCLLGDFAVGKTSLVRRFIYDKFDDKYLSTIGVKVSRKAVQVITPYRAVEVSMILWDLAGGEEYERLRDSYMKGTAGVVLVCDLTRPETLEHVQSLATELRQASPEIQIVLAGNKVDLVTEMRVSREQMEAAAGSLAVPHYLTSAKDGELVESLFHRMAELLTSQAPAREA